MLERPASTRRVVLGAALFAFLTFFALAIATGGCASHQHQQCFPTSEKGVDPDCGSELKCEHTTDPTGHETGWCSKTPIPNSGCSKVWKDGKEEELCRP